MKQKFPHIDNVRGCKNMNSDFKKFQTTINDPKFLEIENWDSFLLSEIAKNRSRIYTASGIYAIANKDKDILYIGKAKSIYGRLNSHYKATLGKEKASAWKQFFEYFNTGLLAYYYKTDGYSKEYEEGIRQALEKIIQIKYRPLFDRIYISKGKKFVQNIDDVVKSLKRSNSINSLE